MYACTCVCKHTDDTQTCRCIHMHTHTFNLSFETLGFGCKYCRYSTNPQHLIFFTQETCKTGRGGNPQPSRLNGAEHWDHSSPPSQLHPPACLCYGFCWRARDPWGRGGGKSALPLSAGITETPSELTCHYPSHQPFTLLSKSFTGISLATYFHENNNTKVTMVHSSPRL